MSTLKDLIELLGASWPIALGLLLASAGLLSADYAGMRYLSTLPHWVPGAAFVGAVLSSSVLIVSGIESVARLTSRPFARKRKLELQQKHIDGLADLPDSERWLLAWAVANQTQVFSAPYFNSHVKALLARGYVHVPGGNHSVLETPLMIPDHIWEALKEGLKNENLSHLRGQRPFGRW